MQTKTAQKDKAQTVLITGGSGFIGSHTCVALASAGYDSVIADNLSNSNSGVIDSIERISGVRPTFYEGDIRDQSYLERIFSENSISAVIHFAGLKAVGESVERPLEYYDNNIRGTLNLLAAMGKADVKTLIFSSSATVYSDSAILPIREDFPRSTKNPYSRTKLMVEDILADIHRARPDWQIALLRYFNPVGAHKSGLIGEDPKGVPNNLMPYIAQVAIGHREHLNVFGGDYPTPDGTGVRDYIHVMDLAEGHVAALGYLCSEGGLLTANMGTGTGVSVMEMIRAFESASGQRVLYRIVDRRPGDIAEYWADPTYAQKVLGWKARRTLSDMCASAWRWQSRSHNDQV